MKPDKSGEEVRAKKTNLETLEENWELGRKWNEEEKFLSQWLCKGCCWNSRNRTLTSIKIQDFPIFFQEFGACLGWFKCQG